MPNNVLSRSHCVDCGRARSKQQPPPQVHAVVVPPATGVRSGKINFNAVPYQPSQRGKNSSKGTGRTTGKDRAARGKGCGTPPDPVSSGVIGGWTTKGCGKANLANKTRPADAGGTVPPTVPNPPTQDAQADDPYGPASLGPPPSGADPAALAAHALLLRNRIAVHQADLKGAEAGTTPAFYSKMKAIYGPLVEQYRGFLKLCTPPHTKVAIAARAVEKTRKTLIAVDHQLNQLHDKLARAEAAAKAQELLQSQASAAHRAAERDLHQAQVEQAAAAAKAAGSPPPPPASTAAPPAPAAPLSIEVVIQFLESILQATGQPAADVQAAITALVTRTNATRAAQAQAQDTMAPALLVDPSGRGRGRAAKREAEPDLPQPSGPPVAEGVLAITDIVPAERSVRRRTASDLPALDGETPPAREGLRRRASDAGDAEEFDQIIRENDEMDVDERDLSDRRRHRQRREAAVRRLAATAAIRTRAATDEVPDTLVTPTSPAAYDDEANSSFGDNAEDYE